jgi:hypothetical protein
MSSSDEEITFTKQTKSYSEACSLHGITYIFESGRSILERYNLKLCFQNKYFVSNFVETFLLSSASAEDIYLLKFGQLIQLTAALHAF